MSDSNRKFIFIINPSSGSQKLRNWEKLISSHLSTTDYEILYTRYPGHSSSLLANYPSDGNLCIVAVGGDGTINELIPRLLSHNARLGIVPTGSGNGLARHLKIPLVSDSAIQKLNTGTEQNIDLIKVNEKYCCNTCGIGFTALVTKHFGRKGKRGFTNYFKLALQLYKSSVCFELKLNDRSYYNVWLVEFANSSQLGNNAIVSPTASVQDGLIDILVMQKPRFWQIPSIIIKVLSGRIVKSGLIQLFKAQEVRVTLMQDQELHIDGEYIGLMKNAELKIVPAALKVIC